MRQIAALALLASLVGVVLLANEKPPAAFQQAMKDNGAMAQKIGRDADAKDYAALAADAAALKAAYAGPITKYFADAKHEAGLAKTTAAITTTEALEKAATARDDAAVAEARRAVTGGCQGCHAAHRERLPDGTYEIK
jgi:cytochrome c556